MVKVVVFRFRNTFLLRSADMNFKEILNYENLSVARVVHPGQ